MNGEIEPVVFVVDDDPAARTSLVTLVTSLGYRSAAFASAEEFLASVDDEAAGCLITDLRMAGMSGEQLQEALRSRGVTMPVIVISGYADTSTAVRVMRRGAMTLLEKPCRNEELTEAIRQAIARDARDRERRIHRRSFEEKLARLSRMETEVLHGILLGKPNKQIAKELDIGLRTVEAHRQRLFEKMEAVSVVELARLAVLAGYDLPSDD